MTQAAQFSKYTAPGLPKVSLVAGRQAEVRVFAVTPSTATSPIPMPTIRVKINGTALATIAPPSPNPFPSGLPTSLSNADEINTKHSYNYIIPASKMTSGVLPVEAVVLDSTGAETGSSSTISINVVQMQPLVAQIVPLVFPSDNGGTITGVTTNIGTALVAKYYPFPSASFPSHAALSVIPVAAQTPLPNDENIIAALETARQRDDLTGFYYGVMPVPPAKDAVDCGAGYVTANDGSSRSAFGADQGAYAEICSSTLGNENHVMPHEMAHAFGLEHAPCGGASSPDPWFSSNGAATGNTVSDGWDFANSSVSNGSSVSDVMGYCKTYWVGAYDWSRVLSFFQSGPAPNAPNSASVGVAQGDDDANRNQAVVHVIADVSSEDVHIRGSFSNPRSFFRTTRPGPVVFEGFDAFGKLIFRADAAILHVHAGDDSGDSFLNQPISDGDLSRLVELRVTYSGHTAERRSLPSGPPSIHLRALDQDHVRVTFDGRYVGEITLRPSGTSTENSQFLVGDGTANSTGTLDNSAADLYCEVTDGIKTVATGIKVHVEGR